jgi:site-specific recombinase XerD
MLEKLFSRTLSRYTSSPHAADLEAFATMVAAAGYRGRAVEKHVRRLQFVLSDTALPADFTIGADALRAAFAPWPRKSYVGTRRLFERFLRDCGRLGSSAPCEPRFALKEEHFRRLVELRGLAPATITYDNWALTDFLVRTLQPHETPASLTRQRIDEFFRQRGPQLARRTFHHTVQTVRRFLRYAFDTGALTTPLHEFELPKASRFEQPPRALSAEHVRQLLASIDRRTCIGRRDHAMLHLMASYGLRPGEIAALRRSSIDWEAGTLRVEQSKTGSVLVLPLASGSLAVLRQYLDGTGPPSGDDLFSKAWAPCGPLSACAISVRFKVHVRRSGLPIADASAYCLRHSFAMGLLRCGVGMKLIGDLLGHHSLASTSAYLRIQTDMLREVALEVPTEVAP